MVDRIAVANVVADVGDRDDQSIGAGLAAARIDRLAIHRVVEVLRRLTVDGDQREITDIASIRDLASAHFRRQLRRLPHGRCTEFERQIVLPERDLDFHPGIGVVAEDLDDMRERLRVPRRLRDHLGDDHLSRLRRDTSNLSPIGGNQQVLADPLVFRNEEPDASVFVDASDDLLVRALEHFDHGALGSTALVEADDARADPVAMQHLAHLSLAEEYIRPMIVAREKTIAVWMSFDGTRDQIELFSDKKGAFAVAQQLAVAFHREQPIVKGKDCARNDTDGFGELVSRHRHAAFAQQRHDGGAFRWNGIRARFGALGMRLPARALGSFIGAFGGNVGHVFGGY